MFLFEVAASRLALTVSLLYDIIALITFEILFYSAFSWIISFKLCFKISDSRLIVVLIESSVVLDVVRCRNCDVPGRFRALHRMIESLHFSVFSLASYDGVEALPRFIALRYDFAIIRWTRTLMVAAFQDTFELELFDSNPLITVARKAHLSHRKSRGSRDNLCRTFASTKSPRKPEKPRSKTRKRSEFSS